MKKLKKINTATYEKKQQSLVFQLNTLRAECEKNKRTPEEERLYEDFVYQLVVAEQTVQHCDELLKAHTGDSECEFVKALKENNVDISAYHSGSMVVNHCLQMGGNGDEIMDAVTKGMEPTIKNLDIKKYLKNICVEMKKSSSCGTK